MNKDYVNKSISLHSLSNLQDNKKLQQLSKEEIAFVKGGLRAAGFPPPTREQMERMKEQFEESTGKEFGLFDVILL